MHTEIRSKLPPGQDMIGCSERNKLIAALGRVIVNVAVALGVMSTNYVPFTSAFAALSVMMVVAAILQISLVPKKDLSLMMKEFRMSRRTQKVKIV